MIEGYVYKQTAINAICQDWCNRDYCGDCFFHGAKQAIDVLKALPSVDAQSEQRWIPCSKGMPENGRTVLVTDWSETDFGRRYDGRWWSYDDVLKDVSAWMPLPEPYKAESEEV